MGISGESRRSQNRGARSQREWRPRPQVIAKAIHGEVRVTLGGPPLDEWHQWRRPRRPRTTGCRLAAGTITRSGCRRDVGSPRLLGSVSAGRVSATSRDGCSVFDPPTSLHIGGSVGGAPIGRSEAGSRLPSSDSRQVMGGVRMRAWTANRDWQPTRGDATPGGWEHGHRTANRRSPDPGE